MKTDSMGVDGGWIKLHRKIMDHPDYLSEPFPRIMAWIDLLMLANHKGKNLRIRGNKVEVTRGQTAISHENLAVRWRWSRGKVRRYLIELEKEQRIVQHKSNVICTITIVNYNEYQSDDTTERTPDDTANSTADGRQTVQQTDTNKNVKNNNKEKIEKKKGGTFVPPTLSEVSEYVTGKGFCVEPENFVDFYESKGWMVGKNRMTNWQAAVRTWHAKNRQNAKCNDEPKFID